MRTARKVWLAVPALVVIALAVLAGAEQHRDGMPPRTEAPGSWWGMADSHADATEG